MDNLETNINPEELRQKEEAAWKAFIYHWHEVWPRRDTKEIMESDKTFEDARRALEDAGGSWEELKTRKEKEMFEKK
ncbi:hypothetical protein A2926_02140 [Candidatus Giovannonibacteria bacterium RIFCSPLOWO2_01_FULL_44_40]|uniref:Uncharacterized protein n=1 Tax=Candidatus Giovannonibacteria bacterium RIFCSPHIGHO2_01_FULL_45_23 TaxID=1798325 RepID=A0A1F5VGI4_9BACT|nr:MAG: hypothetical protein A2834_03565 [Candidatus Giovannonibacteria bacterium RIFCSPHIGHO2_01_FULL_45_23]OGF75717.1 MAG: hypothetical protein A3C77_01575 [Candidatus Giovannonibacteria bacterium RIFCSPHIGHO2_02_FULL_45_13]OGF79954.1 MAG: hypothetical protein A2926_02140 [Candidatus Giovannonibacteria bacterium RIFCSPLOWO2_01_FULL_44_40]